MPLEHLENTLKRNLKTVILLDGIETSDEKNYNCTKNLF